MKVENLDHLGIVAGIIDEIGIVEYINPHSARNGRQKTIKKQAQGEDSSVGRREGRNLGYEDEEEINWKYV